MLCVFVSELSCSWPCIVNSLKKTCIPKLPFEDKQSITLTFPSHLLGLTFLSEGNLSSDGIDEEHLAGGNPGCLFHEAEAQLSVGSVAVITVQRLHLHERDP